MENKVQSTYKSNDTEEWLDKVWTRKIGYLGKPGCAGCLGDHSLHQL